MVIPLSHVSAPIHTIYMGKAQPIEQTSIVNTVSVHLLRLWSVLDPSELVWEHRYKILPDGQVLPIRYIWVSQVIRIRTPWHSGIRTHSHVRPFFKKICQKNQFPLPRIKGWALFVRVIVRWHRHRPALYQSEFLFRCILRISEEADRKWREVFLEK